MSISEDSVATDEGDEIPVYRSEPDISGEGDLPELPRAWRERHFDSPLLVMCDDCSWTSIWERCRDDCDEHPHADDGHTLSYATVGDLMQRSLDRGQLEVRI